MAVQRNFGKFYLGILNGTFSINWPSDTIKCGLVTSAWTPDVDAHDFWDDANSNEVANGNGYTTGGVTLTSVAAAVNAGAHETRFTANPAQWTSATFTWRYAVVYKSTGTASTSPLIAYFDPGGNESVTAGTATVTFDATGVFKIAY